MHAGGPLRSAFAAWAWEGFPDRFDLDERTITARWLVGQLWHCSDVVPPWLCGEIGLPAGSTYAAAVQSGLQPVT